MLFALRGGTGLSAKAFFFSSLHVISPQQLARALFIVYCLFAFFSLVAAIKAS